MCARSNLTTSSLVQTSIAMTLANSYDALVCLKPSESGRLDTVLEYISMSLSDVIGHV